MKTTYGPSVYRDLKNKEDNSGGRKLYPGKGLLRVPNYLLPKNIQAIKRLYVVLRKFDDICDGDDVTSIDIDLNRVIIDSLIESVIDNEDRYKEDSEFLLYLRETFQLVHQIGGTPLLERFRNISYLCVDTLAGDRKRIGSHQNGNTVYPPEEDVNKYIDDMELHGVFQGLLLLLGYEDLDVSEFRDMIHATRKYYYFARDIHEDTNDGLINYDGVSGTKITEIQLEMKEKGSALLEDFLDSENNPLLQLTLSHRAIINRLYITPAKKYFKD